MSNVELFSLFTTQEAAEIIGVSDAYLRQLIARKQLLAKRAGKRTWLIPGEEVDRLKQRRENRRPSQP
jgi:excisionase family DNA binding protein